MTKEIIFWVLIISLLVYEAWAFVNGEKGDTISEIVWRVTKDRPIIPFIFGLLMGHFFWTK